MNSDERKKLFIEWAENYKEHKYTKSTINTYASTLERISTILKIDIGCEFFDINSKEKFAEARKKIESIPGYVEFNRQYQHGVISAALGLFSKYIHSLTLPILADSVESNFNLWMKWQPQRKSPKLLYNQNTIDSMISILRRGSTAFNNSDNSVANCFDIDDVTVFESFAQSVYGKATQLDQKYGHHDYRNALDFYHKFLTVQSLKGINYSKIETIVDSYEKNFDVIFDGEKYKIDALEQFNKHWDINASDFAGMLEKAFSKCANLLASGNYFAYKGLVEFAQANPETARALFKKLYNETEDFVKCANEFKSQTASYFEPLGKSSYQDLHAVSVYAFFMYPHKYCIYKSSFYNDFAKAIGFNPEKGNDDYNTSRIKNNETVFEAVKYVLSTHSKGLLEKLEQKQQKSKLDNISLNHWAFDVIHSIRYGFVDFNDWWPSLEEYDPGFTKDQWLEILNNPEIVGPVWGGVLAMFHTEPQGATCKMIADKFNNSPYSISGKSTQLAKRIHAETNCPIFKRDNDETEKLNFWTILFQGRDAKNDEPGTWVWRLRRELYDALTEFGIEKYLPDVSKLGKFDSWEIIDEVTAIKHCDKSFFEYNTSGVPKGICWFFDAEELADGESRAVKFICDGIEYSAKVANDTTDRRRTKIAWNSDLAKIFNAYKNVEASAIFKKITENTYEIIMSKEGEEMTTKQKIEAIKTYIAAKGFNYEGNLIENFYLSLKSKPFVILAGTSGTGKTRLVKLFAEAIGAKMKLVPVRPDWSDSSDLFGHTDLSGKFQPGAIIDFIKQAEWNKDTPYFLCLDEMNLARVEYYLSDFLSVIETRDRKDNGEIETDAMVDVDYYKDKEAQGKYGRVFIPENLYIVGTVNMDETTFPFSKKVLDRANTIEFSFVNLMSKPAETFAAPQPLNENNSFLKTEYLYLRDCNDDDVVDTVCFDLEELNAILVKANLHVGYRVRDEISFYMMNNKNAELLEKETAFDNEIMQKILPRIQGSSRAIKDVLSEMFIKCAGDYTGLAGATDFEQMQSYIDAAKDCKYPNSAKKIAFMMRRYEEDGFTSYWL